VTLGAAAAVVSSNCLLFSLAHSLRRLSYSAGKRRRRKKATPSHHYAVACARMGGRRNLVAVEGRCFLCLDGGRACLSGRGAAGARHCSSLVSRHSVPGGRNVLSVCACAHQLPYLAYGMRAARSAACLRAKARLPSARRACIDALRFFTAAAHPYSPSLTRRAAVLRATKTEELSMDDAVSLWAGGGDAPRRMNILP